MVYHFGKLGYLALQRQTAEGTPDTFTGGATLGEIGMPITDQPGLKPVIEKEFKNYYKRSSAEYSDYTVKRLAAEGDIKCPAFPGGPLELMLYGLFGKVTSTAVTEESTTVGYTNKYVMDPDLPIWTAAIGRDALNYQRFYDVRFGSMDIDMKSGDDIELSCDVNGKGGDVSQAAFTPAYTTHRAFAFDDIGIGIDGVYTGTACDITEMSLKIDRGIKSLRTACLGAAKGDNVIYTTTVNVEGSVTMMFQNYDEYAYWLGGASVTAPTFDQNAESTRRKLNILMKGSKLTSTSTGVNQLDIELPLVIYDTAEIDMPFDDRMMVQFDFKCLQDQSVETATAGAGTIKATQIGPINAANVLAVTPS